MKKDKRDFIIDDLMVSDFLARQGQEMMLVEFEETGKSELTVRLASKDNLFIANVDKKKTEINFFQ